MVAGEHYVLLHKESSSTFKAPMDLPYNSDMESALCVRVYVVCVCVCRGVFVLSLNHLHKLEVMSLDRYTIFDVYKCCIRFTI